MNLANKPTNSIHLDETNFGVEEKKGLSEEEQKKFKTSIEEEKNIQKDKQNTEVINLIDQLNENNEKTISLQKEFINLSPNDFDQDKKRGWRRLSESSDNMKQFLMTDGKYTEGFEKAILVMEYYLKHHEFNNEQSDMTYKINLRFHIGQHYAIIGKYDQALIWFNILANEGCTDFGKSYLHATIAFLQKDIAKLKIIYEQGGIDVKNGIFIEDLYKYSDMTYYQAYSGGMSFEDIYKHISENMKK